MNTYRESWIHGSNTASPEMCTWLLPTHGGTGRPGLVLSLLWYPKGGRGKRNKKSHISRLHVYVCWCAPRISFVVPASGWWKPRGIGSSTSLRHCRHQIRPGGPPLLAVWSEAEYKMETIWIKNSASSVALMSTHRIKNSNVCHFFSIQSLERNEW